MSQQLWSVNSLGGYLGSDQFSKKIRHAAQPLMKWVAKLPTIVR